MVVEQMTCQRLYVNCAPGSNSPPPRRAHSSQTTPPPSLIFRLAVLAPSRLAPSHVASTLSCTSPLHDLDSEARSQTQTPWPWRDIPHIFLTILVLVFVPPCLLFEPRVRLDGAACYALVLFADPAATTLGFKPLCELRSPATRKTFATLRHHPHCQLLPPCCFVFSWAHFTVWCGPQQRQHPSPEGAADAFRF